MSEWLCLALFFWLLCRRRGEVLLPQGRSAYRCDESFEIAVAGLGTRRARLRLRPSNPQIKTLEIEVGGTGATCSLILAPYQLAPDLYRLELRGGKGALLRIVSGVAPSSLPWSQAGDSPEGNFQVVSLANVAVGQPLSPGLSKIDQAVGRNLPIRIYSVWTSFVTHQPWGAGHSWENPQVRSDLRLFTRHAAQRLRRFGKSIMSVGMIDEPLLSCGRTAEGLPTPGLPAWDEADCGRDSVKKRCGLLAEVLLEAKQDLQEIWPAARFSTDLWAPEAILQGCDAMMQALNDIPCTHVFSDQGGGKLSILASLALARSHSPGALLAHAMNGELRPSPDGTPLNVYRLMRNLLLAGGVESNWWLNHPGISKAQMQLINDPAYRLGPFLRETAKEPEDVALLWSFSELVRRAPREACDDYKEMILNTYQAVTRAGYGVDILHEDLLERDGLEPYRVMIALGLTGPVSEQATHALERFSHRGGEILSEFGLPESFHRPHQRWAPFQHLDGLPPRTASRFRTTHFLDESAREAAGLFRDALSRSQARPLFQCDSFNLAAVRRRCGEGRLIMIVNGAEALPAIAAEQSYQLYNHVPCKVRVQLPAPFDYLIEGHDWSQITRLTEPAQELELNFLAGEMKLLLAVPRLPEALEIRGEAVGGQLRIQVRLHGLQAAWPLEVVVKTENRELYRLFRTTAEDGLYQEILGLGGNLPRCQLEIEVSSPLGPPKASLNLFNQSAQVPLVISDAAVRVLDAGAIQAFLQQRPTIAVVGKMAPQVAQKLRALGLDASSRPEPEVARKVHYPRVWPAYISRISAPPKAVKRRVGWSLQADEWGRLRCRPRAWNSLWLKPGALARVEGQGWYDCESRRLYETGCLLRWDAGQRWQPLPGHLTQTVAPDAALRSRWSRPWARLESYLGGERLCPQAPEAWTVDDHLILLGDGSASVLISALNQGELLSHAQNSRYPGPGRALLAFAWSPFALHKNVVLVGASDPLGLERGVARLLSLAKE